MRINSANHLETGAGEAWQVRFEASPNTRPGLQPAELVLCATERANLNAALSHYKKPGSESVHFLLARDGLSWVQMVPLDLQAQGLGVLDRSAVRIALDYTLSVTEVGTPTLENVAGNNKHYQVALYPPTLIDGLLELVVFLQDELGLDELLLSKAGGASPVNALTDGFLWQQADSFFPWVAFLERLFERTGGKLGETIALERTTRLVNLRQAPGEAGAALAALPEGTPVSIRSEWQNWLRVDVMEEVAGQRWLTGWLDEKEVEAVPYKPVVRNHRLFTEEGRRYPFIPAQESSYTKTGTSLEKIRFVVMHATTGTRMLSTINTFLYSPRNVSAHLVIGRNGRILQMVPFNHAANHTGGFWERLPVRPNSIGIEMDNACDEITKHQDGTYSNRGVGLPASEICETRYWKDNRVRPWQIYPPIQVQATQAAVQALKAAYLQIDELLEHERINIRNRADPGPLFDTDALRQAVLGKASPAFKVYKIKRETALYENACYLSPELNVPAFLKPLPECLVEVLRDECDYWVKIKVHKCEQEPGFKDKSGWVRKNDVKFYQEVQGKKLYNMKREQQFFKDRGVKDKPPCLKLEDLPQDTLARVQQVSADGWTLIAIPEQKLNPLFLEGWILSDDVEALA